MSDEEWDRNTHWDIPSISKHLGLKPNTTRQRLKSKGIAPRAFVPATSKNQHSTVQPVFNLEDIESQLVSEHLERRAISDKRGKKKGRPTQSRPVRGETAGARAFQLKSVRAAVEQGVDMNQPFEVEDTSPTPNVVLQSGSSNDPPESGMYEQRAYPRRGSHLSEQLRLF